MSNTNKLNIKLTLSYIGTNFSGFQYQTNANTIQGELEKAAKRIFKKKTTVIGATRTDAGVHALEQTANFKIESMLLTMFAKNLPLIFNAFLPKDIVVNYAEEVDLNFHSRFSAKQKLYAYFLYYSRIDNPFFEKFYYRLFYENFNVDLMQKFADKYFVGERDFASFGNYRSNEISTICNLKKILIFKKNNLIVFSFLGNRFLYKMVRILVGCLIDVGRGALNEKKLKKIIADKDRTKNKIQTAPAKGLFLVKVYY